MREDYEYLITCSMCGRPAGEASHINLDYSRGNKSVSLTFCISAQFKCLKKWIDRETMAPLLDVYGNDLAP
jgi:hypothetical protein